MSQYLSKLNELNKEYTNIENKLNSLPKPINVDMLQIKYYEYVKNINKEIQDEEEVIYSTINKVYIVCSMDNPVIDIIYIFE